MDNFMDRLAEKVGTQPGNSGSQDVSQQMYGQQMNYGQRNEQARQPVYNQRPQEQPVPQQPYGQQMPRPNYSQPVQEQPGYGQPMYSQNAAQPVYENQMRDMRSMQETPVYQKRQEQYAQPMRQQPQPYEQPARSQMMYEPPVNEMPIDPYQGQSKDRCAEAIEDLRQSMDSSFEKQAALISDVGSKAAEAAAKNETVVPAAIDPAAFTEVFNASATDLKNALSENIHAEDVKCYRNIQAVVEENSKKLTEQIEASANTDNSGTSGIKGLLIAILIFLLFDLGTSVILIAHIIFGVI